MIPNQHHYRDQVRYTDDQVEALIATVWDVDHVQRGPAWKTPAKDPGFVPPWILGCADVDRAFYRCGLTEPERTILRHVHWEGFLPGELAEAWGEAVERIDATAQSGIRKIRRYLNGETPA